MLNPKKLTSEQRMHLIDRFTGTVFGLAPFVDIWFDDTEIKYIETKMMTHKLYRLVNGNAAGIKPREEQRLFDFQREWLNSFYDDPNAPLGVRAYIHYYIGHEQACMQIDDKICDTHEYENSLAHQFLVEKWMETCR